MEIEILDFIPEERGFKIGYIDFKVKFGIEKWEIFRNVAYFEKDGRKWLDIGKVQRDGKWIARYERMPSVKNILSLALKALEQYLERCR